MLIKCLKMLTGGGGGRAQETDNQRIKTHRPKQNVNFYKFAQIFLL
jgi:hypothetical protein